MSKKNKHECSCSCRSCGRPYELGDIKTITITPTKVLLENEGGYQEGLFEPDNIIIEIQIGFNPREWIPLNNIVNHYLREKIKEYSCLSDTGKRKEEDSP